jgi:hypothetical protein
LGSKNSPQKWANKPGGGGAAKNMYNRTFFSIYGLWEELRNGVHISFMILNESPNDDIGYRIQQEMTITTITIRADMLK